MGKLRTFSRRAFLVGSVAVAGGVVFGTYAVKTPHDNPLLDDLAAGNASFNPWVLITREKVVLIANHTDMGQGARSVQATLIAEELDIDLDQVEISPGMPAPAYYNTASVDEVVPFSPLDDSFAATSMRGVVGAIIKLTGIVATGGSSTVPDQFVKLRQAGASARETLKLAAANRTGVAAAEMKTERGAVILPDGTSIPYTDLAGDAAGLKPVMDVALRSPEQWRLIGKNTIRTDIVGKSTGTLKYGIDLEIEGMLFATVKVNPRQGGALNGYDAAAAEAMPGVQKIIDVPGGVAVVASNTWIAFQAANAIIFDWGPAPYPAEQADHWAALGASFVAEHKDSTRRDDGDVTAALNAAGDTIFEAEYRVPYVAHAPLEPLSALVLVTEDRTDIWTASQMPIFHRNDVAKIVGMDKTQVHLHNQFVGGSFGHRLEDEQLKAAAHVAMAMPGVPIKLTYSREEDFAHDYPRQIAMGRVRGVAKNGQIETLELNIAAPSVFTSQFGRSLSAPVPPGPDGSIVQGTWDQPLAIPNFRVNGYRLPLHQHAPVSSWRSVGSSSNAFILNSAMDELIHAAGGDPLTEWLRLLDYAPARKTVEAVGDTNPPNH